MRRTANSRLRLAAVLTVSSLALLACGSSKAAVDTKPSVTALKVGVAYDVGGRGDRSFNDAAAAGLDKAVADLGIKKEELSPNASGSDRGDNLRQLAEDGFNPVIAIGFAYAESLGAIAKDFPDTTFFIVDDASVKEPNVKALLFSEEQGSFLVGAAAALKSKTGNVGYIGGVETPLLKKFEAGFVAGAKHVKPGIKTQVKYLTQPPDFSGFGSPDKGRESANGMYDAGSDIIYAAAGGSGTGVFQSALAKKAKAIGVDSDQYESIGDAALQPVILTSMLKRVDVAVFESLEKFAKKEQIPASTVFDLAVDGVGYSESGGFVTDIKAQLDALKAKIIAGEIKVPTTP